MFDLLLLVEHLQHFSHTLVLKLWIVHNLLLYIVNRKEMYDDSANVMRQQCAVCCWSPQVDHNLTNFDINTLWGLGTRNAIMCVHFFLCRNVAASALYKVNWIFASIPVGSIIRRTFAFVHRGGALVHSNQVQIVCGFEKIILWSHTILHCLPYCVEANTFAFHQR